MMEYLQISLPSCIQENKLFSEELVNVTIVSMLQNLQPVLHYFQINSDLLK